MASQTRLQVATPAPGTGPASTGQATEPDTTRTPYGNQAAAGEIPSSSPPPGRLAWSTALGEQVGGHLYDLLAAQLTEDKLVGHANRAVDAAIAALRSRMQGAVEPSEQEAADLLLQQLDASIRDIARKAVVDTDASEEVLALVGGHPYEVAVAAVAGAVAYVLTNQDLPMIEQKLGLGGGHSLLVGLDLGRTLCLSVDRIRAGYRFQGGGNDLSLTGEGSPKDESWQVTGRYARALDPGSQLVVSGTQARRPGEEKSRLDLGYNSPNLDAAAYWERIRGDRPLDTVGGGIALHGQDPLDLQGYARGRVSSDRSWEAAAGVSQKLKGNASWAVEGFGGQDATGRENVGMRALFKWTF